MNCKKVILNLMHAVGNIIRMYVTMQEIFSRV